MNERKFRGIYFLLASKSMLFNEYNILRILVKFEINKTLYQQKLIHLRWRIIFMISLFFL